MSEQNYLPEFLIKMLEEQYGKEIYAWRRPKHTGN